MKLRIVKIDILLILTIILWAVVLYMYLSDDTPSVFEELYGLHEPNTLPDVTSPVLYDIGETVYYLSGYESYKRGTVQGYLVTPVHGSFFQYSPTFEVRYILEREESRIALYKKGSQLYTSLPLIGKDKSEFTRVAPKSEITLTVSNKYTKDQPVFIPFSTDDSIRSVKIDGLEGYVYFSPSEQDILYSTRYFAVLQSAILNEENLSTSRQG